MEKPVEILMIDDDQDNFDSLKNQAAGCRVKLSFVNNLTDGLKILRESKKITGVILDGRGFIHPNQDRGSDKEDFVHEALLRLALLESEQGRIIAKCVLTAWYDKLIDGLESRVQVYDKKKIGGDPKEMFSFLKKEISKTDIHKVRRKFTEVFDVIEADIYLNENDTEIYQLLEAVFNNSYVKQDYNLLRDVLEKLFIALHKKKFLPANLFKINSAKIEPNQADCLSYLKGREIQNRNSNQVIHPGLPNNRARVPNHIAYGFDYVKKMSNSFSHPADSKHTKYSFESTVLSLCELLIWYGTVADKNLD